MSTATSMKMPIITPKLIGSTFWKGSPALCPLVQGLLPLLISLLFLFFIFHLFFPLTAVAQALLNPINSHRYFCIGFVLEKIIEYQDLDQNGEFNPNVDEIVSRFNFLLSGYWDKSLSFVKNGIHHLNTTTKDGMISLQWSSASVYSRDSNGPLLVTPNSTRLEIEIRDYPFQRNGTKLALSGYVASDGGEDTYVERASKSFCHIVIGSESNQGFSPPPFFFFFFFFFFLFIFTSTFWCLRIMHQTNQPTSCLKDTSPGPIMPWRFSPRYMTIFPLWPQEFGRDLSPSLPLFRPK